MEFFTSWAQALNIIYSYRNMRAYPIFAIKLNKETCLNQGQRRKLR